ncbi:MAG: heme exporter protein CcmB [Rhodospirillaceae bacterium]
MRAFVAVLKRDLRLSIRQGADTATGLMFFIVVVALFPLAIGPDPAILGPISGGVLMVMALLAATLSFDRLFQQDFDDGTLEQLLLSPLPVEFLVLAKCLGHWLTTGLPMIILTPILGLLLNLPAVALGVMLLALGLTTVTLSLLGAVAAALTIGARRGGILVALLVLPLAVPVLIFGVGAIDAAVSMGSSRPHLLLLGAAAAVAAALAPWATAAALRQAMT